MDFLSTSVQEVRKAGLALKSRKLFPDTAYHTISLHHNKQTATAHLPPMFT